MHPSKLHFLFVLLFTFIVESQVLTPVSNCLGNCVNCAPNDLAICKGALPCEWGYYMNSDNGTCDIAPAKQVIWAQLGERSIKTNPTLSESWGDSTKQSVCEYNSAAGKKHIDVLGLFGGVTMLEKTFEVNNNSAIFELSFNLLRDEWMPFNDFLLVDITSKQQSLSSIQISFQKRVKVQSQPTVLLCGNKRVLNQKFNIKIQNNKNIGSSLTIVFTSFLYNSVWGLSNIKLLSACSQFSLYDANTQSCSICDTDSYLVSLSTQSYCEKCTPLCSRCRSSDNCTTCLSGATLENGACTFGNKFKTQQVVASAGNKSSCLKYSYYGINTSQKLVFPQIKNENSLLYDEIQLHFRLYYYPTDWKTSNTDKISIKINKVEVYALSSANLTNKGTVTCSAKSAPMAIIQMLTPSKIHNDNSITIQFQLISKNKQIKFGVSDLFIKSIKKPSTPTPTPKDTSSNENISNSQDQSVPLTNETLTPNNTNSTSNSRTITPNNENNTNAATTQTDTTNPNSTIFDKDNTVLSDKQNNTLNDKGKVNNNTSQGNNSNQNPKSSSQSNESIKDNNKTNASNAQTSSNKQTNAQNDKVPTEDLKPDSTQKNSTSFPNNISSPTKRSQIADIEQVKIPNKSNQIQQNQAQNISVQLQPKEQKSLQVDNSSSKPQTQNIIDKPASTTYTQKKEATVQMSQSIVTKASYIPTSNNQKSGLHIVITQAPSIQNCKLTIDIDKLSSQLYSINDTYILNGDIHIFLAISSSFIDGTVTVYKQATSRLLQSGKTPIAVVKVNRFDTLSSNQLSSISAFSIIFSIFAWIGVILIIVSVLFGYGIIMQEYVINLQLIFLHVYIAADYLPLTFRDVIGGLNIIENLNYFIPVHGLSIEKSWLGDVLQNGPLRFIVFNADINFTRQFYPIIIINVVYFLWFLLLIMAKRWILRKDLIDQQKPFFYRMIDNIVNRPINYIDQIWRYQFLATVWACFIQFYNLTYPQGSNRSELVNSILCIVSFICTLGWPAFIGFYCHKYYYENQYSDYLYKFQDIHYRKIPEYFLPSNHHRVGYPIVRCAKLFIAGLVVAYLGNIASLTLVVLILIQIVQVGYAKFHEIYSDSKYFGHKVIENVVFALIEFILFFLCNFSSLALTQSYIYIGFILSGMCLVIILNGLMRVADLASQKYKEMFQELEWEINQKQPKTERVV